MGELNQQPCRGQPFEPGYDPRRFHRGSRDRVCISRARINKFLAWYEPSVSPEWLDKLRRHLLWWRQQLNRGQERPSLASPLIQDRVRAALQGVGAQQARLSVLKRFLAFLTGTGELRPDQDHLEGLPLEFFRQ